jgi:formylglycine-generating enzyme required for sulfatase activity
MPETAVSALPETQTESSLSAVLPHEPSAPAPPERSSIQPLQQEKPVLAIVLSSQELVDDAHYAADLCSTDERLLGSFTPLVIDTSGQEDFTEPDTVFNIGEERGAPFLLTVRIQNLAAQKLLDLSFFDTATGRAIAFLRREYQTQQDIARIMPALTEYLASRYQTLSRRGAEAENADAPFNTDQEQRAGADFVWVDAGTYYTDKAVYAQGKSGHRITVTHGFYLGKTEVTQQEWYEVMGMNPSGFKGLSLPVENVSWFDAIDYCNARSRKEGLTPVYTRYGKNIVFWNQDADGYRLPTESEWELAARGGAQGGAFPDAGSAELGEIAWYAANSENKSHPVGNKRANELGLFDMSGNVWEWCWDWYEERRPAFPSEPPAAAQTVKRVLRGGSWSSGASYLTPSYRNHSAAEDKYSSIGFRVLREGMQ